MSQKDEAGRSCREVIKLDLPANHQYLSVVDICVGQILSSHDFSSDEAEDLIYGVRLAVYEACTNIVDHAYKGQSNGRIAVTIFLSELPQRLVVELRDCGESFDPRRGEDEDLDEAQERGYGLRLMRHLLDEVQYQRTDEVNRWLLIKNL